MTSQKQRFLVRSGIEPEPGWVWVSADAADDIRGRYPGLEIAGQPADWLTPAELESLRVVDIDDRNDELLLALRRSYQTYEAIDLIPVAEGLARDLPCRLCGHLPAEHAFDLLCPPPQ